VLRRLAELFRSRGDESRARDILQRFAEVVDLAGGREETSPRDELRGGASLLEDDDADLFGSEFPDSEGAPEIPIDFGSGLEIGPGASLSGKLRPAARAEATVAVTENAELLLEDVREKKPTGAGDWDQLLAEASVYLRYGKRDKAIAHLVRVLEA